MISISLLTCKIINRDSIWKDFESFVEQYIRNDVVATLNPPTAETPNLIAAWIFLKCETPNSQIPERAVCQGLTFSTALKMRAAVSFYYNQQGRSGNWSQMLDGSWSGNPSLSSIVSRYMLSLQKRKV